MHKLHQFAVVLGGFLVIGSSTGLHYSNSAPLRTVANEFMDAHDGNTIQLQDKSFVRFAMGYGTCIENGRGADGSCGQLSNNTVGVWTSPDLSSGSWTLAQSFTPSNSGWPLCTYFRVHALRRTVDDQWVMWLNGQGGRDNNCSACPEGAYNKCFLVGVAPSFDKPFVFKNVASNVRYLTQGGVGDFSLFSENSEPVLQQADDGTAAAGTAAGATGTAAHDAAPPSSEQTQTAYIIYKRSGRAPGNEAHRMSLQQLQPDLTDALPFDPSMPPPSSSAGIFGAPFVEAPELFKRGDTYYALFGQCCAFCQEGSGIGVYTAAHPLGPWASNGNVGCNATTAAERGGEACGCALPPPWIYPGTAQCKAARTKTHDHAVTWAQQNSVIKVDIGGSSSGSPYFIWTGDRWQSACTKTVAMQGVPPTDVELNCVKAYDLQYWAPIEWDETVSPPLPKQFKWMANWTI